MAEKTREHATKKRQKEARKAKHGKIGKDHKHKPGDEGDYEPHHAVKGYKPRR
jgi:hypothetical protein